MVLRKSVHVLLVRNNTQFQYRPMYSHVTMHKQPFMIMSKMDVRQDHPASAVVHTSHIIEHL